MLGDELLDVITRYPDHVWVFLHEFPALTAVVLGGSSLAGGIGRPADTAAAILALSVITNVMTINDYQYPSQLMAQGLLLTVAVAFYAWRRGRGGKS